ncbi:hypothetical protein Ancab_006081 [Ancistrocladus abbreviatus]
MASENMGLVPTQRLDPSLSAQLLFQDDSSLRFSCSAPHRRVGDHGPKTRELSGFMDDKLFSVDRERCFTPEFRRSMYGDTAADRREPPERQNWSGNRATSTTSAGGDGSEDEEDEEEDDDDDDDDEVEVDEGDDGEVEGLVGIDCGEKNHSSGGSSVIGDKIGNGNSKGHVPFGGSSAGEMMMKDGRMVQTGADMNRASTSGSDQQRRVGHFQNSVTIAEPDGDMYYSQFIQGSEGSGQGQKDISGDNGCGFSGRKDGSLSSDPGESLRAILSDPVTGALMDDAMILPCGHSFGAGGIQRVIRMKACYTCSHPVSEDLVRPNLSLRVAVQAFRREEDLLMYRASKRRRERFEQDKANYGDSSITDAPRGRGVQFPFAVSDRVIIKGNKRTPQRFVGREAIVTTQCLNGWYVVKTLDNAESVKLQYRSLAKVPDNPPSKVLSNKTPNWL